VKLPAQRETEGNWHEYVPSKDGKVVENALDLVGNGMRCREPRMRNALKVSLRNQGRFLISPRHFIFSTNV
jgi:hypothetical protein